MNKKGIIHLLPLLLVGTLIIAVGGLMVWKGGVIKTSNQNNVSQFVSGEVLVMFSQGTTYKQAKDLLNSLGVTEFENGYYTAMKIDLSDDMVVDKSVFTLLTIPGKEDELINKLSNENIVKTASKNFIGHITQ